MGILWNSATEQISLATELRSSAWQTPPTTSLLPDRSYHPFVSDVLLTGPSQSKGAGRLNEATDDDILVEGHAAKRALQAITYLQAHAIRQRHLLEFRSENLGYLVSSQPLIT